MNTKSALLFEAGYNKPYKHSKPLKIVETELDPIEEHEVLIKIRAAGLCHSDLSVITGTRNRALPISLGHEAAGEVIKVGKGVSKFEIGDHVICTFVPSCGICQYCRVGRPSLCEPGNIAGRGGTLLSGKRKIKYNGEYVFHHSGVSAFAEHSIVSESSIVKISKDIPFEVAAIFGCAVITGVGSVLNSAKIETGSTVGIIGLGGVGLSALLGAVAAGAGKIIVFDINEEKLNFAMSLGATHTCNVMKDEQIKQIKTEFLNEIEYAIETAGANETFNFIYELTKPGGTVVTTSLPHPTKKIDVSHFNLTFEEKTIKGSYIGSSVPSRDIPRYIELYRQGKLPVDKLISDVIAFDEINEGFDKLSNGDAMRIVINFDR